MAASSAWERMVRDKHGRLCRAIDAVLADFEHTALGSLAGLIDGACNCHRDRIAFEQAGTVLDYDALDRLSQDLASYLQHIAGLYPGDRVALMMPNLLQAPVAVFGVLRAGFVVTAIAPDASAAALAAHLDAASPRAIIVADGSTATLAALPPAARPATVLTTGAADLQPLFKGLLHRFAARRQAPRRPTARLAGSLGLRAAMALGRAQPYTRTPLNGSDGAFLRVDDGNGPALLTHGALVERILGGAPLAATDADASTERSDAIVVNALPIHALGALSIDALPYLQAGARSLLIEDPADAEAVVAALRERAVAVVAGTAMLYRRLLEHPAFATLDFSRLRHAICSGRPEEAAAWRSRWQAATGLSPTFIDFESATVGG